MMPIARELIRGYELQRCFLMDLSILIYHVSNCFAVTIRIAYS